MPFYLPPKISPTAEALLRSPPSTSTSPTKLLQTSRGPPQPRAASWSGWVRNVFPSNRPERGRTIRASGYWEEHEQKVPQTRRRRIASSRQSDHGEAVSPDRLTRWNTAKKIPRDQRSTTSPLPRAKAASPKKKMSDAVVSPVEERGRSLTDDKGRHREADTTHRLSVPENEKGIPDTTKLSPETASMFDRRLSNVRRTLEAKNESRRQRRSLKESGDYLGVQGINPETGQLDIITPTESERSSVSDDTLRRINTVRRTLKDAKDSYKGATAWTEREMKKILVGKERAKNQRLEKEKQKHQNIIQAVKWRRNTKQWSSVHEPNLSPIAQSQTSIDGGSRRPSKQVKLVDLVSSGRSQPEVNETESEADSQDSADTTIRTPHRLSLANPSSYAMELFENGISFDHPNNKPRLQLHVGQHPLARYRQDMDIASPTSQHGASEIPSLHITSPRNSTRRLSLPNTPDKAASFLEMTGPHRDHSIFPENLWDPEKNAIPTERSRENLRSDQGTVRRHGVKDLALNSAPHRQQSTKTRHMARQNNNPSKICPADSDIHSANKGMMSLQTSPSRKRRLARRALHSMTNLRNHHEPVTQRDKKTISETMLPKDADQIMSTEQTKPLTKDRIQQDLEHLRSELDKLNQQKAAAEPPERDQCLTDHEWIEDTIRDITQKGNQIVAECASTPTITITGSDQAMSQSNQRGTERQQMAPVLPRKRPLNRLLYNLPVVDSPDKHRELQTNPSWSISVKPKVIPRSDTTGTTSTSHLAVTKQRTEKIVRHMQPRERTNTIAELIMDSSPKSTSSMEAKEVRRPSAAHVRHQERQTQNVANTRIEKAVAAEGGTLIVKGEVSNCENPIPRSTIQSDVIMEPDLVRLPGSYPIHPDAVAIEDHSQTRSEGVDIDTDGKGPMRILFIYLVLLINMYWEIVGPVFNKRSDYWGRSARGESTIVDGCTILLAMPVAVFGMTGLL